VKARPDPRSLLDPSLQVPNILKRLRSVSMLIDTFADPAYMALDYKDSKSKEINRIREINDYRFEDEEEDADIRLPLDDNTMTDQNFRSAIELTDWKRIIATFPDVI
jgi:hypothetical protein